MSEDFVFISYGRDPETNKFVQQLKLDLINSGFMVWLDIDDIPAGSDWHASIGTAIQNCKAMIVVITQKYMGSRYCTNEMYVANTDGKPIFPVFLQDVDFSITETARGVKYVITGINWIMCKPSDDYKASLTKLIDGLKGKGITPNADGSLSSKMDKMNLSDVSEPSPLPSAPMLPQQYPMSPPTVPPVSPQMMPPPPPMGSPYANPGYQGYPMQQYPVGYQGQPWSPPQGQQQAWSPQQQQQWPPQQPWLPQQQPWPPQQQPWLPQQQPWPQGQQLPLSQANQSYPNVHQSPFPASGEHPPRYEQLFGGVAPQSGPQVDQTDVEVAAAAVAQAPKKFKIGMRLEAVDRRFPYFVCVATITNIREEGEEVLIHFDGWSEKYDYWCVCDAVELHPMGWCKTHDWEIQAPQGPHKVDFEWRKYLKEIDAEAAPKCLFKKHQLAAPGSLHFKAGMRIEAKDRKNSSLTCVATIADVRNRRMLIHFDGWSDNYNYWCTPDSIDIHPPMWCSKNGKKLEPPKGHKFGVFRWSEYLGDPMINPAPAHLFTDDQISSAKFKSGMKLEAKDRMNPNLTCVASITDVKDGQLLIHFDGWSNQYDYWCKPTTTDIHPAGWCKKHGYPLQPPNGYDEAFNWNSYLSKCKAVKTPENLFTGSQMEKLEPQPKKKAQAAPKPNYSGGSVGRFQVGMKLEAVDRQYPTLICVATITDVTDDKILIHFDNWGVGYDYWCEPTTTDIHPIGWCSRHNHALQAPKGYHGAFHWDTYLSECDAEAVPDNAFTGEQAD